MIQNEFAPKNTSTIAEERKKESFETIVKTNLPFLQTHNGYRPAALHLVIGLSGGGKSTTKRTQVLDYYANKNELDVAGIWYSEESENDFEIHYAKTPLAEKFFDEKKVKFYSELDSFKNKRDSFKDLDKMFELCDIVFFDNITTSSLFKGSYQEQETALRYFKGLVKKHEIPLVAYAHTSSQVKEGFKSLIEMNDVRGSKEIVNLSEFVYILQQIHIGKTVFSTLKLVKYRGQEVGAKLFHLNYNPKLGVYDTCSEISFTEFKNQFDMRNKL